MTSPRPEISGCARSLAIVRRLVLVVLVLTLVNTGGELLLVDHTESAWQWIPLVLIALSLIVLGWHALANSAVVANVFRTLMLLCMVSGIAGMVLHYNGKVEFKLETNPNLAGWELFSAAIQGPAPPVLAPCLMIQIGLLGLAYSYSRLMLVASNADAPSIPGA